MAIAFDNATDGGQTVGTSLTYSHVTTGSNLFLIVAVGLNFGDNADITGVTYNGVALTQLDAVNVSPTDHSFQTWYLFGATSGTHNVVVSSSVSITLVSVCASYTGVPGTSLDANITNTTTSGSPNTNTLTTVSDNCWHIVSASGAQTISAGTGATQRVNEGATNIGIFDGNGVVHPAGSNSISINLFSGSFGSSTMGVSVSPTTPSQILKVSGVTLANIAKVSSVAKANIKKISGVANS